MIDDCTTVRRRTGFTLSELMAVIAILGVLASIVVVRATSGSDSSKIAACKAYKGNVELQAELWKHNTGSWPATDLSTIAVDLTYFPTGLPACPVDGSVYAIDSTGCVVGHNH